MNFVVWGATSTVASALERFGVPEPDKWKLASNVFDKLDDLGPKLWQKLCADAAREFDRSDRVSGVRRFRAARTAVPNVF